MPRYLGSAAAMAPFVGVPGAGTNEVQTLTIGGTPTGGTFTITVEGFTTAAITWSSNNTTLLAAINAALDALVNVGTAGIVATAGTLTAGIGTILLTCSGGNMQRRDVALMTATSSLTGTSPTAVIATTTPGVEAAGRGAARGAMVVNSSTGIVYTNTSATPNAPTWTVVGTQT